MDNRGNVYVDKSVNQRLIVKLSTVTWYQQGVLIHRNLVSILP